MLYIPLSRNSLQLFDCTKLPNGAYHLDINLEVSNGMLLICYHAAEVLSPCSKSALTESGG